MDSKRVRVPGTCAFIQTNLGLEHFVILTLNFDLCQVNLNFDLCQVNLMMPCHYNSLSLQMKDWGNGVLFSKQRK